MRRRDFTINALYYCPIDELVIDYVGGYRDIKRKKIRPVIPLKRIFSEDPVRMIRAVKYAELTGFEIPPRVVRKIRSDAPLLADISASRLTEELFKILRSGNTAPVLRTMDSFNLLEHFLPRYAEMIHASGNGSQRDDFADRLFRRLEILDERIQSDGNMGPGKMLAMLLWDYLEERAEVYGRSDELFHQLFREAKNVLKPSLPPNREVEYAVGFVQRKIGMGARGKKGRKRRPGRG